MRFHLFRRLSCRAPCVFPEDEPDLAAFPPDAKLAFADSPTLEDADVRPVHPVEALTHTLGLDPTYAEFQAHLLLLSGRIARLDSLAPSPATNAAFGELVALSVERCPIRQGLCVKPEAGADISSVTP